MNAPFVRDDSSPVPFAASQRHVFGHQRRAAGVAVAPFLQAVQRVVGVLRLLRLGVRREGEPGQRVVLEAPRAERSVGQVRAAAEHVVVHAGHLVAVDRHPVEAALRVVGVRRRHRVRAVVVVDRLRGPAQDVELRPLPQRRRRVEGLLRDVHRGPVGGSAAVRLHRAAAGSGDDLLREERVVRVARALVRPAARRRGVRGEVRRRDVLRTAQRIVLAELPPPALRGVQRLHLGHDLAAEDVEVRNARRGRLRRAVSPGAARVTVRSETLPTVHSVAVFVFVKSSTVVAVCPCPPKPVWLEAAVPQPHVIANADVPVSFGSPVPLRPATRVGRIRVCP